MTIYAIILRSFNKNGKNLSGKLGSQGINVDGQTETFMPIATAPIKEINN